MEDSDEIDNASIRKDSGSVRRAWREGGYGEFWIELRTQTGNDEAFGDAVAAVNERFEPDDGVYAQLNTRSPNGFVVSVSDVIDDAHLDQWLEAFAAELERLGFDGVLGGVRPAIGPEWWTIAPRLDSGGYGQFPPTPTGFIAWSVDLDAMTRHPARQGAWHVPEAATVRISDHLARWVEPGGSRILLSRDTFRFAVDDGRNVSPTLSSAALASGMTSVFRHVDGDEHGRAVHIAPRGETTLQIFDATQSWSSRIDDLRRALTALPDLTDVAFIRPARRLTTSWISISSKQDLDALGETDLRYNRHLLIDYLPDAHGIQVVRDEHLTRAHDLSNWIVSDLGHGRHLIEATDLEPWYSGPLPNPDVVNQARRDFGSMILTKDVITATPPPWNR